MEPTGNHYSAYKNNMRLPDRRRALEDRRERFGKTMIHHQYHQIDFTPEIHCDDCQDVVHNHFDCPVCNTQNAGTSLYRTTHDLEIGDEFWCEACKAGFELVDNTPTFTDEWVWEEMRPRG